jgi:thiamine-phosphate pyrophosphorylase
MNRLYPIVDLDNLDARGIEPIAFAERLLKTRPRWLQLRAKHASAQETLAHLDALLPLCRAAGTELFANDRADLALLSGAAGVHVGQTDLPLSAVRRLAPALKMGVSTHSLEQLTLALGERPDYVAFGPVFTTASKERPDPVVGLDALRDAAVLARAANVPLVAIGGITVERCADLAASGVYAAVIGALSAGSLDEVTARAEAFSRALGD